MNIKNNFNHNDEIVDVDINLSNEEFQTMRKVFVHMLTPELLEAAQFTEEEIGICADLAHLY